jgi:hypothetical protein
MAKALALLDEAIEELAALDADAVTGADLHEMIRRLGRAQVRLEAQVVRVVHRWDAAMEWADNASKAPGARLARETHLPRGQADKLVTRGRKLQSMPLTTEAYASGEINGAHVDLIATCDREWVNTTFAESEDLLVNNCKTKWFDNAVRATRHWQMRADRDVPDPDNPDPDKAKKKAERDRDGNRLSASRSLDGKVFIDGLLDTLGGEIFLAELDRLYERLRLSDLRDGIERTPLQRRAAALVEMATRSAIAPADGQRPKPLITITMGAEHFEWMCQTAAGIVIEPELVLPYLSEAEIERIIHDPANRKLEASQRASFTGAIRKIISLRDQHCQHPSGCDEPAHKCDVDHIEPRSCGGITCICNGQLLCTYHNRIVKAEHDRRLALQHKAEREAERHQTGCLLAHPEPADGEVDTTDDEGDWRLCRVPDRDDPRGWVTLDEFRRRHGDAA